MKALTAALERAQPLDPPAETLQKGVAALFEGAGAAGLKVRDFLHGVWFGHPLHPVLVAIPVGAWTAAAVLDACEGLAGRRDLAPGADAAIAVGIAGAVGSAATGITDWHHLDGARRRVGFVHGLLNAIALLLYTTASSSSPSASTTTSTTTGPRPPAPRRRPGRSGSVAHPGAPPRPPAPRRLQGLGWSVADYLVDAR